MSSTYYSKKWPEVSVTHPSEVADALSAFLFDEGAEGLVQEEDADGSGLWLTKAGFDPVMPLEDLPARLDAFLDRLVEIFGLSSRPVSKWGVIEAGDWTVKWKEGLEPIEVGSSLVVKPTWCDYPAKGERIVIELDPGMAFGTGRHESTFLCLELLEKELIAAGERKLKILDVGTGSGILALAAAALGQSGVMAIDVDREVMNVAEENFIANGLEEKMHLACAVPESIYGKYDLILANLTSGVILECSEDLNRLASDGGILIMSGILIEQADAVVRCFEEMGFTKRERVDKGEWTALKMVREPAA